MKFTLESQKITAGCEIDKWAKFKLPNPLKGKF